MNDVIKIKGTVHILLKNADGTIVLDKDLGENTITSVGKAALAGLAGNTGSVPAFTYLAVGTGSTAPVIGDTTLTTEITDTGLARASATVSRVTTTVSNDTLQLTYTWTASGSKTIQELGILNNTLASGTSILLGHKLTGAISVVNTQTLTLTYKVQFS